MKNLAFGLILALGLGLAQRGLAQEGIASPQPSYANAAMAASPPAGRPPQYGVVKGPNGTSMIVGGSREMLAREDLAGLWQVMHYERNGTADPLLASQLQMRFYPGKVELMEWGRPTIGISYQLETRHEPRHFSWAVWPCGYLCTQRGVYWRTGDKLLLCLGAINDRRAPDFLTQPGDGRTLFILQRVFERPAPPAESPATGP